MKKDNRGVTLVELVIAIAIMGILVGFFVVGTGYINNSVAKGAANSIKTGIGQTRVKTMGQKETYLYIYKDGQSYMMETVNKGSKTGDPITTEKKEKIAKSKATVSFKINKNTGGSIGPTTIDGSNYLLIGFNRENGKLDLSGETLNFDGTSKTVTSATDESSIVINVVSGPYDYEIKVHAATGKVEMKRN